MKPTPGNSRAQRILAHAMAQPVPATARTLHRLADPEAKLNTFHGSLAALVNGRKLVRSINEAGETVFTATPDALVDRRRSNGKPGVPRKRRKVAAAPPSLPPPAKAAPPALRQAPAGPSSDPPGAHKSTLSAQHHTAQTRALDRDQLAADLAAFEAKGGVIQQLAWGESAASIAAKQQAYLDNNRRSRAEQQARRAKRAA